jgi:excisionase family DNA binding protein
METSHDPALLVTVREAMHLLHRGRARIYEMCATGELETIRDGRSILIPRDALDQWIAQKRRKAPLSGRSSGRKQQASIL